MNYPKVSIVTPSLNQGQFIEEAILSVLSQDYPNIEYIVIDGGSTDSTLDILKKYDNEVVWISEPDRGQVDAINKGWRMASGEILTWLNADDLLYPGAIRTVVNRFLQRKEIEIVHGDVVFVDRQGNALLEKREIEFDYKIILYGINYICPTVFLRRCVLQKIGYLDQNLQYVFDHEFYLRAAKNGVQFTHIPEFLFKFRLQQESKGVAKESKVRKEGKRVINSYREDPFKDILGFNFIYAGLVNKIYRIKRQWVKLRTRKTIDNPFIGNFIKLYCKIKGRL